MAVLCCAVPRGSVMSNSLQPMDCSPPGSPVHGDSLGKNAGVGCHALLQGIFLTQGLNPGFLHSLPSELLGKPFGHSQMVT